MPTPNQNPEQLARDLIDRLLLASGWLIQNKSSVNLSAAKGIAISEYQTNVGPADYILFVDKKPVGVIEAKREEEGVRLTMHEDQFEVPKMLIFAKSDSHADDIIQIVRKEFAEENKFCKKITYRSNEGPEKEEPKTVLQQFRREYYPRIAVTVDMIATGTDIRPLEVLLFMRDVKSRSYYEQMKGRGTRTCSLEELQLTGTRAAKFTKDHFVIIDAVGVEKSQKTASPPLEKKPGVSLKELLEGIAMGNKDEDMLTTLANRLIRLDKQINEKEKTAFAEKANGQTITQVVKGLLNAYDPDTMENLELKMVILNLV